jgi:hypothetical protein
LEIDRPSWGVQLDVKLQEAVSGEAQGRKIPQYEIAEEAIRDWLERHAGAEFPKNPPNAREREYQAILLRMLRHTATAKWLKPMLMEWDRGNPAK